MTPIRAPRRGATLIELLVVLAIASALGAMALMLLPSVANSEYTTKGVAEVQTTCKTAQAMAAAARLPRGVRLLVPPNGTTATEMQYLEAPPIVVPDPQVLVGNRAGNLQGIAGPQVLFEYELYSGTQAAIVGSNWTLPGNPPVGTIKRRHCYITGLNADQTSQVVDGSMLVLPNLNNSWSRIKTPLGSSATAGTPAGALANFEVELDVYPDAALGAGTTYRAYHFGIYGVPVPLLAEPTVLMPNNIGIDLEMSRPPQKPADAGKHYDIMFAPSGQTITTYGSATTTISTANTGVFLWVRDVTKVTNPGGAAAKTKSMVFADFPNAAAYGNAFRLGGEQQLVGIRNGLIGGAPVLWPAADGSFTGTPVQTPYTLVKSKMN